MSIRPFRDINRRKQKSLRLGKKNVGGNNPISVQSMTNTLTKMLIKQLNKSRNF